MKRILHLVGSMNRAGAETMLMNYYRNINRNLYQFDFIYFTQNECDYDREITELGGSIFRLKEGMAPVRYLRLFWLLLKLRNHEVVHSHMNINNGIYLFVSWLAGKRGRISHSHGTAGIYHNKLILKLYRQISFYIIKIFANNYIACGRAAAKYLYPNVEHQKVIIIPNAINTDLFVKRIVSDCKLREELRIEEGAIIVLQIGRLSKVKNQEFSIKLMHYIKRTKNTANYHLVLVGIGELEEYLKNIVDKFGLNEEVSFLGLRTDIASILGQSQILIMPSLHEGFPMVLVESQAAGTPALISDTISNEVDLGIDLVRFCSLDKGFERWLNELNKLIEHKIASESRREELISRSGFSIKSEVRKLELVYEQT